MRWELAGWLAGRQAAVPRFGKRTGKKTRGDKHAQYARMLTASGHTLPTLVLTASARMMPPDVWELRVREMPTTEIRRRRGAERESEREMNNNQGQGSEGTPDEQEAGRGVHAAWRRATWEK